MRCRLRFGRGIQHSRPRKWFLMCKRVYYGVVRGGDFLVLTGLGLARCKRVGCTIFSPFVARHSGGLDWETRWICLLALLAGSDDDDDIQAREERRWPVAGRNVCEMSVWVKNENDGDAKRGGGAIVTMNRVC